MFCDGVDTTLHMLYVTYASPYSRLWGCVIALIVVDPGVRQYGSLDFIGTYVHMKSFTKTSHGE